MTTTTTQLTLIAGRARDQNCAPLGTFRRNACAAASLKIALILASLLSCFAAACLSGGENFAAQSRNMEREENQAENEFQIVHALSNDLPIARKSK
mmetsp:Transcript_17914/g.28939  ORF Transcript_17914/g.28939 Transcript_17914/m.28939 type:complete len:96 (-) Transcript_17914:59-346(-)